MQLPSCRYPSHPEPRWRPRARLRRSSIPAGLRDWLLDPGSLTRRLRQTCAGQFRVKVIAQYWARPLPSEAQVLGIKRGGYVWIREVQLFCDTQVWVFARTLIPAVTLRGRCRRLTRLGTRPLGEVLFTDPSIRRGEVEIACIGPSQCLHQRAFGELSAAAEAIWGRRSVFHINDRPLLVCEIFLPGLPILRSAARTGV